MKKRILSMIVALSMILTMVPFAVMAEDEAVEPVVIDLGTRMGHTTTKAMYDTDVTGMTQIKTVDGADSGVYYSISADGVLTIKGDKYVQMPTVDTTDQAKSVYGWYGNANVTKVVICEGITSIGVRAFETMSNLAEIQLPSTLVSISAYAFNGVSKLTSIEIPEGATRL
ncbi:MAG: leucine-rich repeat domain-containing protein [Clostridia bacterium]|nr:leucine-rich repeat domain-containing protein [Clostridia bacterium]